MKMVNMRNELSSEATTLGIIPTMSREDKREQKNPHSLLGKRASWLVQG